MANHAALLATPLFEHGKEAVFTADSAGTIRQVTPRFAELLGRSAGQLPGTSFLHYLPSDAAGQDLQYLTRAVGGEVVCYEAHAPTPQGPAALLVHLFPLLADNAIAGVYGIAKARAPLTQHLSALVEGRHPMTAIFDAIADVVFVLDVAADGRYRFAFVNRAYEERSGIPVADVVGRYLEEVVPEPLLSLALDKHQQVLTTRQSVSWQAPASYPRGRLVEEIKLTPVLDEAGNCCQLVGIVHDLTHQKEVEEALRASNERFQYALKATTDALYDWNIAADTLYWGEGFEELFGYHLEHNPTPFSEWADYVHVDEHSRVVAGLRQTAYETLNSFWQQEYRFRRADGSWAVVFDRGYILRDDDGQPVRMIGAMQDITDRKQAEENQRLMADRLVKQNADLQQFTYIVSHNLRAPLANALGFADLLSRIDRNSQVFDESLRNLRTSIRQLDEVLTDVNSLLSSRDQQDGYRPEPVAVAAACRQALSGLEELLRECGGQLHFDVPADLRIAGSRAYFHSIFHNLISNAIKYRSDARPLRIDISATVNADQDTTIIVRDNGSGFDQARAGDDVFQLYQRLHTSPTGRGIGLFLVKAHVESMYGQISVRSRVDEGTQFILYFRHHVDENLSD